MDELAMIMKMIESVEGLTVSVKIGKESELVIKGDFLKIVKAFVNAKKLGEDLHELRQDMKNFGITKDEA